VTTVVRSLKEALERGGRVDPTRLRQITDHDIDRMIADDPDTAPVADDLPAWRRVYHPPPADVKVIRRRLGLSQAEFAKLLGFSVRTVQQWERGETVPDRPTRILLKLIERSPDALADIVATA
jgi:putative transcriptional regulator